MSGENRTAIIAKLVKVAKKHYPAVSPPASRSVLENLLYACLLENSSFAAADEAFARLEQYSDWNEVRVTTTQELCELAAALTDPQVAVERLKLALHSIFESHYLFELDFLLKENQGKAIAQLEKYKGVTPFVVSYLVQNSFAGHKIPTCESSLDFVEALGLLTPKEKESGTIPGFERAVPKTKGPEFFSTVHQFAVDFRQNPHDKQILARIKEISLDAFKRLDAGGGTGKTAPGKSDNSKSDNNKAALSAEAGGGGDANKSGATKKATVAAAEKTGGKSVSRPSGSQADGGKSVPANAKDKVESSAKPIETKAAAAKSSASKPAAAKLTTAKSTTDKSTPAKPTAPKKVVAAGKPPAGKAPGGKPGQKADAKSAAKAPAAPAGKKPTAPKSTPSEKPAAKSSPGKKKPR